MQACDPGLGILVVTQRVLQLLQSRGDTLRRLPVQLTEYLQRVAKALHPDPARMVFSRRRGIRQTLPVRPTAPKPRPEARADATVYLGARRLREAPCRRVPERTNTHNSALTH